MFKRLIIIVASVIAAKKIRRWSLSPHKTQNSVFKKLINEAKNTSFGLDHSFELINSYKDFKKRVPIRDYEGFTEYIELIKKDQKNILWPGLPKYFALTSGTTSGTKYIPITKESLPEHIKASKNAMLMYIAETKDASFISGKFIFLQGTPKLNNLGKIKIGRLSGIVAHHVPPYLQSNRLPSMKTNSIDDWEKKVDKIVEETINENMTLISGIPSWVQMYFEKIKEKRGVSIGEVFKNFNMFIYGGVNFKPYKKKFNELIGRKINSIELYPASEGFFAFQDSQKNKDLLLLLNSGIFYEFIIAEDFINNEYERLDISQVKLNVNYVLIISTNAGLWAYNTGDTVIFTSLLPYKILVTGRVKHFISAFGEHVIVKEVEQAINLMTKTLNIAVTEFSVAPKVNTINELPYHEWFIEISSKKYDIDKMQEILDKSIQDQNKYYLDLIQGNILQSLKIQVVKKNGFRSYMHSKNKLGGQFKIPKLSNDRNIANALYNLNLIEDLKALK
jgi:hypothetical protein